MNLKLFLKHKDVQSNIFSLLVLLLIIVFASLVLISGVVTGLKAVLFFIMIVGFAIFFVVTILRLIKLAKVTDSPKM